MDEIIEFNGNCAFAVSIGKTGVKGGRHTACINGKTYAFSNPAFKILPNRLKKAEKVWNKRH